MVNKVLATQAFPTELCSQNPQKKTKQSLGVTRVRELTLLLTSYSTWESRPCNLPVQLTRTEPVVRVSGEQALSKTTGELTPIITLYFPYSKWERGPCTLPGPNSRTGPGDMSEGDLDLRARSRLHWES